MTARDPSRRAAVVALVAAVLLPLAGARWAATHFAHVLATRRAAAAAGYLAVVTRASRGGGGYDAAQLLIRARALAQLPGLGARVEVYHGTAPLIRATAPPLAPATLERLRRDVAPEPTADGVLTPLLDRDGWDVVGAVAVDVGSAGWPVSPWSFAALLLIAVAGAQATRALGAPPPTWRPALARYTAAAGLFGVAAFADVRLAAQDATERWLDDTRLLLEEAAARVPDLRIAPSGMARVAGDAAIMPGDSAEPAVALRDVAGVVYATAAVRLGPGHWIELRARPLEAATGMWLPAMLALALLGPLGARLATWSAAASPRRRRETGAAWAFLAPSALHLAVFTAGPLALAFYLSVHRVNPTEPVAPLIGIAGVAHAFGEPAVWAALGRTLVYAGYVPVSTTLALVVALLLHGRGRRTRILLACFALPSVVSVAAIALVWRWLYQPDSGAINALLTRLGLGAVDWLGDSRITLAAVMLVSVWTQFGAQMTVFLAGLDSIPRAYLDAARLDGANAWQRFRRVTFPLLRPVTVVVIATGILGAGQALTLFAVLTGGGPFDATDVLVHRIYHTGWELSELGDASVLALLLSAVLLGASWILLRYLARRVEYA